MSELFSVFLRPARRATIHMVDSSETPSLAYSVPVIKSVLSVDRSRVRQLFCPCRPMRCRDPIGPATISNSDRQSTIVECTAVPERFTMAERFELDTRIRCMPALWSPASALPVGPILALALAAPRVVTLTHNTVN